MDWLKATAIKSSSFFLPTIVASNSVNWLGLRGIRQELLKKRYHLEFVPRIDSKFRVETNTPDDFSPCLAELARYPVSIATESHAEIGSSEFKESSTFWQNQLLRMKHKFSQLFDRCKPKLGLIVQGYEPESAMIRHLCNERSIPVLAIENTALKDRMIWDNVSGITTNKNLSKNYFWKHADQISDSDAQQYCEQLIASTKDRKQGEHTSPERKFEASSGRPYALFLGQVYTDSSLIFGMADWESPEAVIRSFLLACKRQKLDAVVKLHPKENTGTSPVVGLPYNRLTLRKLQADPIAASLLEESFVHVDFENQWDTYDLINSAKCAVTINSQSGLEASLRGVPSVICGHAFYSPMGFTWEAAGEEFFETAFEAVLNCTTKQLEKMNRLAKKFACVHFDRYCVAKSSQSLSKLIEATIRASR